MSKRYFSTVSETQLKALAANLPQSLIVAGPVGVGLSGAIRSITDELNVTPFTVLPEKNEVIDVQNGTISVDSIRRLYELTKTIETKKRIIVIDYAEKMGIQAQNAFLKLLEEPGLNTYFILLTHQPDRLLPTIQSRAQRIDIQPITLAQSEDLLDELGVTAAQKRTQLLFIAQGLPAELTRLATDQAYFDTRSQIVRDARTYIQGSSYERLTIAQQYKDDRPHALMLVTDAMKMLQTSARQQRVAHQIERLEVLLHTYEKIEANGNIKLQLAAGVV